MHPYNVKSLLDIGRLAVIKEHKEIESTKGGILRGGSTGIITADGKSFGECPRKAYLRYKGIEEDKVDSPEGMFAAGRKNEDILYDWLARGHTGHVFREGEILTAWETEGGVKVTGTPDLVLGEDASTPKQGIEAKLVSSIWTAIKVHYQFKPDNKHLSQAAHYSMVLGIPYTLVYSSRVDWHFGQLLNDLMGPAKASNWRATFIGKPDVVLNDGGMPLKIRSFDRAYDLTWVSDRLYYYTQGMGEAQKTAITKDSIKKFYELVGNMESTGEMGPIPSDRHVNGKDSAYRPCDYCPLKPLCAEKLPFEQWRDHATVILKGDGA